jgi:hypothetical protein
MCARAGSRQLEYLYIIGAAGPRYGVPPVKGSVMKILALTVALLLSVSPVAAQQQRQQALGAGGQTNTSILPNNGLICIEEMVVTFCNQPTSPNLAGYGSSTAFVGSSATSGTSAAYGSSSASGVGAASSSSISTTSIHPCGSFPPPNELCN